MLRTTCRGGLLHHKVVPAFCSQMVSALCDKVRRFVFWNSLRSRVPHRTWGGTRISAVKPTPSKTIVLEYRISTVLPEGFNAVKVGELIELRIFEGSANFT